eukprot:365253-Chlamydomonas_euryale.AAC.22
MQDLSIQMLPNAAVVSPLHIGQWSTIVVGREGPGRTDAGDTLTVDRPNTPAVSVPPRDERVCVMRGRRAGAEHVTRCSASVIGSEMACSGVCCCDISADLPQLWLGRLWVGDCNVPPLPANSADRPQLLGA